MVPQVAAFRVSHFQEGGHFQPFAVRRAQQIPDFELIFGKIAF
jgi:hypothetical protein